MKAQIKTGSKLIIEVEEDSETELFEAISSASETFTHEECGCCKNTTLRYVVREVGGNKYYELHCTDYKCRARLPFGVAKKNKGKLYPKRRWDSLSNGKEEDETKLAGERLKRASEKAYADAHGGYLANNGWYKYVKGKDDNEE